jgi:hypothetical protein
MVTDSQQATADVQTVEAPDVSLPVLIDCGEGQVGITIRGLHRLALSLADGQMSALVVANSVPPGILPGILALAEEIAANRIPLIAVGPEQLHPADANWISPIGQVLLHTPVAAAPAPANKPWRDWLITLGIAAVGGLAGGCLLHFGRVLWRAL